MAEGGKRPDKIRFTGRILFLTKDVSLIRRQLAGEDLPYDPELPLMDNISTDEITPAWVCFYYDETLGRYVYVGMRENAVQPDEVKNGGFSVVVSGLSKGCGSSRETAPFAEKAAGIELVIAKTIEKIYGQNAQNIGLLTSTDFGLIERIARGEEIPLEEFTRGLDAISKAIVEYGGLFNYNKARLAGEISPPPIATPPRPMNIVEKIIARHAFVTAGKIGVEAVKPGDALFAVADVRFSHEYVTPMAEALFRQALGPEARVTEPQSVFAFRDHLTFLGQIMPRKQREMGLLERAEGLAVTQRQFAERQGIKYYGETPEGGSEAICHNAVVEDIALPGQIVIGTDSHTCMAGVLGCFAFGVGATDMANAWYTKDVRLRVPETVRFVLKGKKRPDVTAKDVMLFILAMDYMKQGKGIGQVLEFAGEGLRDWSMDERATLTNMAVEAGGFTGIIEPDEVTLEYLVKMRGLPAERVREMFVFSDPDAEYAATFEIDLAQIKPMVATPGDPRNGIPIDQLPGEVKIDIAYGGSCTGGKMADMDMYAAVLRRALEQGRRVAPGVELYLQFGSQKIKEYARRKGYIEIFERVGARLIDPSCGACINAGPGASDSPDKVTVSAQNRNFPGRSGPGKVYLASPYVVAASAIAGKIVAPDEFLLRGEEDPIAA
ncbi:aconitase family protein [Pyrinomonas methylaliphatogenes]|jgi:3-isopropylmalate/(R)-2-methylmalate dehydratase large subunit|uniref:3-isopropylmalate dehydratase large subunit n=1 Tax=Pyrinomonas methylaliphatogenes TaxID=454194 RepID=A0A0B6WYW3_9BACT|nr:aconitase family protein [Pyrinomonas methylaliphatogenes]MBX5478175.1 3-isopropylmalate dehydratase [Pyrinomonas methylaliphatogenes]CDM66448.1 3-isopropylmalate dehydratase large subunit [Pyrinomonas methylaliphatogenes]